MSRLKMIPKLLFRNRYCRQGHKAAKNKVNLEYYTGSVNLGDALAPVILEWMLSRQGLTPDSPSPRTRHLMTVGSIIGGSSYCDAVIWGSGIKGFDNACSLGTRKYFQKYDIRAVRGPVTRQILLACGYRCPEVYGDPGILMPLIYTPKKPSSGGICLIQHFRSNEDVPSSLKSIDIRTDDYKSFLDSMAGADKVISSSLHGIILAESYGIPAVFLAMGRSSELLKYYDWYFSTGRFNVKIAQSIDEALKMEPMELPDLAAMQQRLMDAFPYDLYKL